MVMVYVTVAAVYMSFRSEQFISSHITDICCKVTYAEAQQKTE